MYLQECKYIHMYYNACAYMYNSIIYLQIYMHQSLQSHYQARDYKRHGDFASAKKKSIISLRLNIAAICRTIVAWLVVGAILGIGRGTFLSTQTTTTPTASPKPSYINGCPGALVRNNTIGKIFGTTGNYTLSFDIVPAGTISNTYGSILHFIGLGGDCCSFGDRAPGIWFLPGTTRVSCLW